MDFGIDNGLLSGLETQIMNSAEEADNLIEQIKEAAEAGLTSSEVSLPELDDLDAADQERVEVAYYEYLG